MTQLSFKNKWILITGASSGLGKAIAIHLARNENANLVLAARRKPQLEELKKEIEASSDSLVKIVPTDLSRKEDVENLFQKAVEIADIYAVINNAGLTFYGRTNMEHIETFEQIIDVNMRALMILTLRFLSFFKKKGEGAILNITSEAGLIPTPYQAIYSASKHAAQVFTEALCMENKKNGMTICSFAPGGIATEMLAKSGLDKKYSFDSPFNMNVDKTARLAIQAFKRKKFIVVPGFLNKVAVFFVRFFPRRLVACAVEYIYKLPDEEKCKKMKGVIKKRWNSL
ncbi:MAG: SDR family NAD(P)-dependent oxidoreductase [Candidatus Omnitrophota bacterium]